MDGRVSNFNSTAIREQVLSGDVTAPAETASRLVAIGRVVRGEAPDVAERDS